jgi:hypothetical protein
LDAGCNRRFLPVGKFDFWAWSAALLNSMLCRPIWRYDRSRSGKSSTYAGSFGNTCEHAMQVVVSCPDQYSRQAQLLVERTVQASPRLFDGLQYVYLEHGIKEPFLNRALAIPSRGFYSRNRKAVILNLLRLGYWAPLAHLPKPLKWLLRTTAMALILAIASPVLLPALIVQCCRDRSAKFYYLFMDRRIPHGLRARSGSGLQVEFLGSLLFYLGLHRALEIGLATAWFSIPAYEFAYHLKQVYLERLMPAILEFAQAE